MSEIAPLQIPTTSRTAPDELSEGLSWTAYRRVATLFQTPAISASQRQIQSFSISQTELDAALMKDRHQTIVLH